LARYGVELQPAEGVVSAPNVEAQPGLEVEAGGRFGAGGGRRVMVTVSRLRPRLPADVGVKMLQLHIPDRLGLRRDYIPD
jgi:hypothetical protein